MSDEDAARMGAIMSRNIRLRDALEAIGALSCVYIEQMDGPLVSDIKCGFTQLAQMAAKAVADDVAGKP